VGLEDLIPLISASGLAAAAGAVLYWAVYSRCYVTVPPNRALVLYGRRSRRVSMDPDGLPSDIDVHRPRILVGSGAFVAPWNRGVGRLSLDPVSVDLSVRSMYAVDGARASGWEVRLRLQAKIPADPVLLTRAAENLLGKTDEEVQTIIRRTVEAAVPSVVARLRLDEGEPDWDRLAAEVQASVAPDLLALGFVIRTLSVTELRRILPAETSTALASAKPASAPASAGTRTNVDAFGSGLDARMVRAERNLELVSAVVARMCEGAAGDERVMRVSVLDYPLGSEVPASVFSAESSLASVHESMEGDQSPLPRPLSVDSRIAEGGADRQPPLE
jgi:SPFH domain / Band 7 family